MLDGLEELGESLCLKPLCFVSVVIKDCIVKANAKAAAFVLKDPRGQWLVLRTHLSFVRVLGQQKTDIVNIMAYQELAQDNTDEKRRDIFAIDFHFFRSVNA